MDVGVDGFWGEHESLGDRVVGFAFGDQCEHVAFTVAEPFQRLLAARAGEQFGDQFGIYY